MGAVIEAGAFAVGDGGVLVMLGVIGCVGFDITA